MFKLIIMACATQFCLMMVTPGDGAVPAETKEACLLPLDVLLDIAEARLKEDHAGEDHVLAWDCIDAKVAEAAMKAKRPIPLRHHRIIHPPVGTDT